MKSRTQQEWRELFKQQADGDLSVAVFCKKHGIGQSYFYKRKSDLIVKNDERPTTNFIKIKHQQTRLIFPTNISPNWLAEFIKALA
jgi:hypothetical protein